MKHSLNEENKERVLKLEFTPLEFETGKGQEAFLYMKNELEFTPLEFETIETDDYVYIIEIRIYSVGV